MSMLTPKGPRDWTPRPPRPSKHDLADAEDEWEEIKHEWMDLSKEIERITMEFYHAREWAKKEGRMSLDDAYELSASLSSISRRAAKLMVELERVVPPSAQIASWLIREMKKET